MSYKDYSEEAVKEIIRKVSNYHKYGMEAGSNELSITHPVNSTQRSIGFQKQDYEYNHPTTVETNRITETHIFFEKWFESELPEDTIWKKIQTAFERSFLVENSSGKIKKSSSRKRWTHIDHSNHETIVSLKKDGRFVSLKVVQRVGFWRESLEGILHGSYTSLILFGIIYGIFEPALSLSIGILTMLWTIAALIIYRLSVSSRRNKQEQLAHFTNTLIEQFT